METDLNYYYRALYAPMVKHKAYDLYYNPKKDAGREAELCRKSDKKQKELKHTYVTSTCRFVRDRQGKLVSREYNRRYYASENTFE